MRIFLVRHGLSQSNVDHSTNKRIADHAIQLTDEGKEQAAGAGRELAAYLAGLRDLQWNADRSGRQHIRMWNSPYTRTRQTADLLAGACLRDNKTKPENWPSWIHDRREHLLLAEQQFGIFDGLSDAEREEQYPEFQAYYEKCKAFEGKLWPKMPLGESRFEVAQRVHQAFGTFHRDSTRHSINNIVVVGHGTTNRAFTMMWLHLPYEWMHEEPNPKNCSIRLLEDGEDKGYIFEGFDGP
jgi:2,3-bisphosphoglycerate-dependent phosphoglycerate mutase